MQWRVDAEQQALICAGDGGHEWLRYDRELGELRASVDWRFTPRTSGETRYNSGVGIRMSRFGEIWHQAQTGPTGAYLFGSRLSPTASSRSFNLMKDMKENRVKTGGRVEPLEDRAAGDTITLSVNGEDGERARRASG